MTPRTASVAVLVALAIVLVMLLSKSKPTSPVSSAPVGEFLSTSSNINPGWQLYTVEGRKPVGLVKKIESNHLFPDGTTQDGVLILFTDATENWVPSGDVKKLYVTKP